MERALISTKTNLSAPAEWHFLMNLCKYFILPHGDVDGRFSGYKNDFLVQSSFHAVECILAYRAAYGSSLLMHA